MAIYRKKENVHGYYTNTYVVVHTHSYVCDNENGESIYAPTKFAVKPEKITKLKEILYTDSPGYKTVLYFEGDEIKVLESFDEIVELIDSYNKNNKKHDLIDDENN